MFTANNVSIFTAPNKISALSMAFIITVSKVYHLTKLCSTLIESYMYFVFASK